MHDSISCKNKINSVVLTWGLLLDDDLLSALQHQHSRLPPVLGPQDLPDGLLHHHAVLLLLLLRVLLNVMLLLWSNSIENI